jgi:hypothetical protein
MSTNPKACVWVVPLVTMPTAASRLNELLKKELEVPTKISIVTKLTLA